MASNYPQCMALSFQSSPFSYLSLLLLFLIPSFIVIETDGVQKHAGAVLLFGFNERQCCQIGNIFIAQYVVDAF